MAKGTLKVSGADAFTASDLAPNSVDTSEIAADAVTGAEIADDAIDSEHIAADSIDAEHYAPGSVDATAIANDAVDSQHYANASVDSDHIAASVIGVKPHIIPNMLYPAVSNVMVDGSTTLSAVTTGPNGSTVQSSKYGTVQSDGRMYYYTDIRGSKPIKDPRIGSHFGSQRHKFKSQQLLKQETAAHGHGKNVYSVDGREWIRICGASEENNNDWGQYIRFSDGAGADAFIEIVGYFSDVNYIGLTYTSGRHFQKSVDGGSETLDTTMRTGAVPPTIGRYVDAGAVHNLGLGQTLGVHTLKIRNADSGTTEQDLFTWAIELIAQDQFTDATCDYNNDPTITHDANTRILAGMSVSGTGIPTGSTVASVTSSTAFELSASTTGGAVTNGTLTFGQSNTQIPSQNVVSYGKKFTVAGIPHFNPFAHNQAGTAVAIGNTTSLGKVATGWAGTGAGYFDDTLDTATSLGLAAWVTGGEYYRPVNGGRVVRWVDSSGNIKTSVNMMPPDATSTQYQNVESTITPSPTTHSWTSAYQPQFGSTVGGSSITIGTWANAGSGPWTTLSGSSTLTVVCSTHAQNHYAKAQLTGLVAGKTYRIYYSYNETSGTEPYFSMGTSAGDDHATLPRTRMHVRGSATVGRSFYFKAVNPSNDYIWLYGPNTETINAVITFDIKEVTADSQAEVAKVFNWREYGNGSVNGDTNYQDLSTLNAGAGGGDFAYVMDDGLTSYVGDDIYVSGSKECAAWDTGDGGYFTFIGTGITVTNTTTGHHTLAQNLPYGTHIVKAYRSAGPGVELIIDGVTIAGASNTDLVTFTWNEVAFHQPKMPPIPEDAVVIADYMLMADWVASTGDQYTISKGSRFVANSRDYYFNDDSSQSYNSPNAVGINNSVPNGQIIYMNGNISSGTHTMSLPYFGTNFSTRFYANHDDVVTINGSASTGADSGSNYTSRQTHTYATLGNNVFKAVHDNGYWHYNSGEFSSPIHTSSHYQTFETPYLHELVGGDRNMEQTNLVVTPDGKTWDEVTRDTSYIGNMCVETVTDTLTNWQTVVIFDEWRGQLASSERRFYNKDFAIGYDRLICLKDGEYEFHAQCYLGGANQHNAWKVNGTELSKVYNTTSSGHLSNTANCRLGRGDYVQLVGQFGQDGRDYNAAYIKRLK